VLESTKQASTCCGTTRGTSYEPPDQSIGMLDARRCHYHAGKSASRGTRVAAQVRHARRGARTRDNILNIHRTSQERGVLSTYVGVVRSGYLNSTSFSRRVSSFGRPRRAFIYNSWLRIPTIFCSLHLPPAATCARRHLDGNPPRRSHQTQPSGSANRVFKPRTGDITQARGGGAPPRRRGAPPPAMRQRSLLRVRISQTSSAPCN
jgi:hypothetical protein